MLNGSYFDIRWNGWVLSTKFQNFFLYGTMFPKRNSFIFFSTFNKFPKRSRTLGRPLEAYHYIFKINNESLKKRQFFECCNALFDAIVLSMCGFFNNRIFENGLNDWPNTVGKCVRLNGFRFFDFIFNFIVLFRLIFFVSLSSHLLNHKIFPTKSQCHCTRNVPSETSQC